MKIQIYLRNGQFINTECTQNEFDVFERVVRNSAEFLFADVPGTKYDFVKISDIISVIEDKLLTPTSFPPAI